MWRLRHAIAWTCIPLVFCPTGVAGRDSTEVQNLLSELGRGAQIKLKLVDGSKLRGQVESIGSEGFVFKAASGSSGHSIDYENIVDLDPAKRVYRSRSERDPVEARRVAVALGLGHHVLTRVQNGTTYRGHIEGIDLQHLSLRLDRSGQSIAIPYSEIDHLEQNLSALAKVGIVAGIGAGICFLIWWRIVTDPNY
jgi:small nuclear ribonucleoprotein (snRNP)-like protein